MKSTTHTYLLDTRELTPAERMKTEELLSAVCTPWAVLPPDQLVYLAHTSYKPDEFMSIPFPDGCIIRDVTGQNLMPWR